MNDQVAQAVQALIKAVREQTIAEFANYLQSGTVPIATPVPKKRPKGARRDPEELASLKKLLIASVKKHPGQGIEFHAKTLNVTTADLNTPLINCLREKLFKTAGERRGTKYTWKG